jgi:hypothetical protein
MSGEQPDTYSRIGLIGGSLTSSGCGCISEMVQTKKYQRH